MGSGYKMLAILGAIGAAAALLIATAALVGASPAEPAAPGGQPAAGRGLGGSVPLALEVELGELYVKPSRVEVPAGGSLSLTVRNAGAAPHNLVHDSTGTRLLNAGEVETVTFGPFSEDARLICDVPGHAEAGMVMQVVVTGDDGGDGARPEPGAQVSGASIDPAATPEPGWQPFDPVLPPAPAGTLHRLTLEATEVGIEVAPGVTQEQWTFDDQVPGPILRGKVGDTFEITLVNRGKLGHSIDFHASKVAWNDEMRTIQPGESLVYRFEAKHAGIFMYHCGTAPALHHIGNGMFGAIIIDPPGLAPVDREFIFVQSELYLGPEGEPGDLGKMQRDEWDAVVFNGYVNQYRFSPIRIEPGRRYRAWVLDAGPSENSSFHVVGTVFDTVFKEGAYLLRPGQDGGAQALDLQPSQGGFVEFTMDEPGQYLIVTHKFSNVGKGALGVFQAGDLAGPAPGAH